MVKDLLKGLLDEKIYKVICLLINNPNQLYHLSNISQLTNVPVPTVMRIMKKLTKIKIAEQVVIGKTKIYRLNDNEKTKRLTKLIKNAQ